MAEGRRPLTHGKDLTAFLNEYEIVEPARAEALELRQGVSMEALVDDARHLVHPLTVPTAIFDTFTSGAAGVFSGCECLVTCRNGSYLTALRCTGTGWMNDRAAAPTMGAFTSIGAREPASIPTDKGRSSVQVLQGRFASIPASGFSARLGAANQSWDMVPVWFPSGSIVNFFHQTANTAVAFSFCWQDVP